MQDSGRKGPNQQSYCVAVEVGMTAKALAVLESLQRQYGGSVNLSRPATEKWCEAYAWNLHGAKAAEMLRRMLPYLRLKSEHAQLAIKAEEIRQSLIPPDGKTARWTPEARDRCQRIRGRIKELNRKGPDPLPDLIARYGKPSALRVGGQWVTDQADLLSDLGWEQFSGPWPTSCS